MKFFCKPIEIGTTFDCVCFLRSSRNGNFSTFGVILHSRTRFCTLFAKRSAKGKKDTTNCIFQFRKFENFWNHNCFFLQRKLIFVQFWVIFIILGFIIFWIPSLITFFVCFLHLSSAKTNSEELLVFNSTEFLNFTQNSLETETIAPNYEPLIFISTLIFIYTMWQSFLVSCVYEFHGTLKFERNLHFRQYKQYYQ